MMVDHYEICPSCDGDGRCARCEEEGDCGCDACKTCGGAGRVSYGD